MLRLGIPKAGSEEADELGSSAGSWRIIRIDGAERVVVRCPHCGVEGGLDHDVDELGRVDPSLDCTECSFHKHVQLSGWDRDAFHRR